jgi:DNA processing protein
MMDTEAWLLLNRVPGLGASTYNKLLEHFGDPRRALNARGADLKHAGLSQALISSLQAMDETAIVADLDWLALDGHHLLSLHDARYPPLLKHISDPPPVLYVRGDPDFLQQPQLAMVGSRNPTASGRRTALEFARHLSAAGITITSGLAAGIDGACHEGALQGIGSSVALVAHGLDIVYPASHHQLAEHIAASGAIVSEMPIGTGPQRGLFPRRNRLISGISLGTLVVEAALKSGSLITARHAMEQGREVFAIPGSIHNPLARGCHQLIRQGAKLVETANDILEELAPHLGVRALDESLASPGEPAPGNQAELDPDHQKLLKCLEYEPRSIDAIVDCSGFSAAEVASMLLILELEGSIVCDSGLYTRI